LQQFFGRAGILTARKPLVANLVGTLLVDAAIAVGIQVTLGGIGFTHVIEHRVGQASQHWLGMLPANRLKRSIRVGKINDLVADAAEIARCKLRIGVEDGSGPLAARKRRSSDIGTRLIPLQHRFTEPLKRLVRPKRF
jgi:hypothetical protein